MFSFLSFVIYLTPIILSNGFQPYLARSPQHSLETSTKLYGKLWDKLEIEPDPLDEEAGWYLMNCVVGNELNLLAQAKHVTRDIPEEYIEKLVVPQERKLRSHGKTAKVVELKVRYPGYVFCRMRICAETYEPLQQLDLCRSWMAGTVNLKGYKKLPPAPIALSDEEVAKFKGLEEETSAMYEKFGEDYTGRGDDGMDLIEQYKGYDVENMVKILTGNFEGEDGVVRRLKDGLVMVRLYTYGNVLDQWFKPDEIRPMTDAEAMKGLTGPTSPLNQDEFDVSIGKTPKSRDLGGRGLPSRAGGTDGTRMRRQDRVNRGETGKKDVYGRTKQETQEEEENWRNFREEQRASQQQKRGDMWGIKERTSWDSGDDAAQFDDDGKWKSGRQMRKENKQEASKNQEIKSVQDAIDGGGSWDIFETPSEAQEGSNAAEDDFFSSLMSELSVSLDDDGDDGTKQTNAQKDKSVSVGKENEDDFFNSLMSELSDTIDETQPTDSLKKDFRKTEKPSKEDSSVNQSEDDFFTDLMSQLSESVVDSDNIEQDIEETASSTSDDDFFASLEADLNESLSEDPKDSGNDDEKITSVFDRSFKENYHDDEKQMNKPSTDFIEKGGNIPTPINTVELNKLTVPHLKERLKARGLKVSGKKADLIARLIESK